LKVILRFTLFVISGAAAFGQSGTPAIDPNLGVQNQGNFIAGQSLAAGSFVAIFGTNFASTLTLADSIPLSSSLGNVSVTFNNVPAPMVAVGHNVNSAGDDQINAQLPWNVLANGATSGTAQVVVTVNNVSSAPTTINIVPAAPGLMIVGKDDSGMLRPVAYNNSDSTLAYPAGTTFSGAAVNARPAKLSTQNTDPLVLLATGLGALVTTPPNGSPPPLVNGQFVGDNTQTTPIITVGGVAAKVAFSGASPQYPSLYQLNIMLDPSTPTGSAVPVVIQMNGLQSLPDLMIAVTN
jgi:uncharacterized protein (TIGR03437 family)